MALEDIHVKLEEEQLKRLRRLCTHRGDLTYHIQEAVKGYVEQKELEMDFVRRAREERKEGRGDV